MSNTVSVSIPGSPIADSACAPDDPVRKAGADGDAVQPSDPRGAAAPAPSRWGRLWHGQRLRSSQWVVSPVDLGREVKANGFENRSYHGPEPLVGKLSAALPAGTSTTGRQMAQGLYDAGLRAPQRRVAADLLAQRMAQPTGLSGWLGRLFHPKLKSIDGLMLSLVAPALAEMPLDMASGLRSSITAEICRTLMAQAFDALDERGRQRWRRRTTATRGSFASSLRRLERQCDRGPLLPAAQRLRATREVMHAMRDCATPPA